ncbi:hypothetical protein HK44_006410 [Pseudomonas fluorescens HK44]|uniref:Uncharacterized protein n=1 Tax=Pseudomonas fluorescens HK44 TaxID=1042209 RepID=A0A010SMB5_PSEFL|nr:hypothetical protein HK44_006410 [Pseudomonas fluorescens HK44]
MVTIFTLATWIFHRELLALSRTEVVLLSEQMLV